MAAAQHRALSTRHIVAGSLALEAGASSAGRSVSRAGAKISQERTDDHSLPRPVGRSLRLEAVAHSGLGDEVAGPGRIVFKLLSECLDVLT